jgi:proteasome accessory factor C
VLTDTASRLRRLLAILAWLAQVGEAPIDETAERFDLTPEALVTELEMAACCGVPPYTPDQLMEIVVTDTSVSIRVGTSLARPRRLSPSEGFALATSARALLAVTGSDESGALSRALAKLDRALGGEEIEVELDAPALLPLVQDSLVARRPLLISYYSASTDRVTERKIAPLRLFASEGHWYVDAWCRTAGDLRRFRVDRIRSAETVAGEFPPEADLPRDPDPGSADGPPDPGSEPRRDRDLDPYVPGPESRRVRLSLDPATAWLVESVPATGPPTTVGDRVEIELFVGGDAWLERLLLRLGPAARVIDPPEYRTLAAGAAARVLRRYEHETL